MNTFSIYSTQFFGRFQVGQRPVGDFKVDRYNKLTGRIERWALCETRAEADAMCASVNRELEKLSKVAA